MTEQVIKSIEVVGSEPPLIEVKANVDPKTIPDGGRLKTFFDRILRLEEEKRDIARDINEIYAEAKGQGFDTKVMKAVLKLYRMDRADLAESEYLRDEYKKMLGIED